MKVIPAIIVFVDQIKASWDRIITPLPQTGWGSVGHGADDNRNT